MGEVTTAPNPNLIWQAYRAFLRTEDLDLVCTDLGIPKSLLKRYLETWEPFAAAAAAAQSDRLPAAFDNLDEETKAVWLLLSTEGQDEDLKQRALLAVANNGERERQKLLAWALLNNHFDVLSALRKLKITQKQYKAWLKDPEFAELIEGVQSAKRHFVEGRLMGLVAEGDSKATMFAAERLMRDTYGNKIEHTGTIEHQHTTLDLSCLSTPLRIQVMEELRNCGLVDPDGLLCVEADSVARLN